MRRQVIPFQTAQKHLERHIAERVAALACGKPEGASVILSITDWRRRHFSENCQRPRAERHAMLFAGLHTIRWNRPYLFNLVDLTPAGANHLAGAGRRQIANSNAGGNPLSAQPRQEGRQLVIGKRRMVFDFAHLGAGGQ